MKHLSLAICLVIALASISEAKGRGSHHHELNQLWVDNDLLVETFQNATNNFAHTTKDANNERKKKHGLFFLYLFKVINNLNDGYDYWASSHRALRAIKAHASKPAQVIAKPGLQLMNTLSVAISKPVALVNAWCGPAVTKKDCIRHLERAMDLEREECSFFLNNMKIYKASIEKASEWSPYFDQFTSICPHNNGEVDIKKLFKFLEKNVREIEPFVRSFKEWAKLLYELPICVAFNTGCDHYM